MSSARRHLNGHESSDLVSQGRENELPKNLKAVERKIIERFLEMEVTGNSCPMPVQVKRCIKMAKGILGDTKIFICDQEAINFGDRDPFSNLAFIKKKSGKSVIFTIMTYFEGILKYNRTLYMQGGRVS